NTSIQLQGIIDSPKSFIWHRSFTQSGEFEIIVPMTQEHTRLCQIQYWITKDESGEFGIIESLEITQSQEGEWIKCSGRLGSSMLSSRIIFERLTLSNTVENIMRTLVQTCCLSPEDPKRTIPLLQLGPLQGFTPIVTMQVTYRNLNQTLYQLTMTHQIGWDITLDPQAKKLNFICYQPTNRSSAQSSVAKVVFSENYENLKATQYQRSQRFLSNLALVGGQGEGEERILVQVGDAEGYQRKEVFINAKDQRWEEELSEQEYIDVLIQKGWQSLQPEVEFFESEVDVNGSTRIRQDFDLGDTVSIEMGQWNMQIHVQVTEISEVFDEMGLRVIPIFGQSLGGMQNQFESDTSGNGSSSTISLPINKAVVSDSNGQLTTGTVTAQEVAMLAGVSSSLQTQLNGKQATIIGAASSVTTSNLTASRATVSDAGGKILSSNVTSTELSYVSGVTSALQSQLNGKAASSHTHLASQITDFLNKVYPVGAIYLSTVSTSPATLFGGSWTQIQNRFLVSAGATYGAGTTGGSETHTHTSAAHNHGAGHEGGDGDLWTTVTGASGYIYFREDGTVPYTQATWSASHRVSGTYGSTSATVGGGADVRGYTSTTTPAATGSSSTNPPYLSVYMWQRAA
ncbi:MAG: hypothetical protein CVU94_08975, partial [Firmicutes bacterium HGW-Firmicutes-19]